MANKNPSPETRFGGPRGNPSGRGKTSEQQKADIKSAETAAKIRSLLLSEVLERVEKGGMTALEHIEPATLKLLKDSEDRAFGTPSQDINHRSDDGSMSPAKPQDVTPEAVQALVDKLTE